MQFNRRFNKLQPVFKSFHTVFQIYEFAYSKYLEQVVRILESDPKFTEKLKSMPEQDIKVFLVIIYLFIFFDRVTKLF